MEFALDGQTLIILIGFGFLAAFIDSVVGGGGLIALPALLFTGLPPASAVATNKLASTMGSFTSTVTFWRSGQLDMRSISKIFPLTIIGAMIGAWLVSLMNPEVLKPLMLIMLLGVLVYTLLNKEWGDISRVKQLSLGKVILFLSVIFFISLYDGFLGPGTGSFLMFAFLFIGYDFLKAAGNAKLLNFGSNIGALVMFLMLGEVVFIYGFIMGFAQIAGAIVGSRFAIKKGSGYVRILYIVVTISLLLKNGYDYFVQ
ncbi:MAG TPA: TSUP family transporter [Pseudogracilibacillus sp.]|nr:TSUP family transporter [Pseudogracilibacillus sp.]